MKFNRFANALFSTTALCAFAASPALAANFTVGSGVTVGAQTIGAGANETGVVQAGGTISTTGNNNVGATSTSTGGTITNNGAITTSGTSSYGIYSTATDNILSSTGSITTSGSSAPGIFSNAANNTITNSGTISTTGGGHAFDIRGGSNIATNSGTIITSGGGYGAFLSGDSANSSFTNTGSITASSNSAEGVSSNAAGNIILNSGSITTNGTIAHAIISNVGATNNRLTNTGSITTNGNSSTGLYSLGADTIVSNSGSITTGGSSSAAMRSTSNNNTFTNNGTITTNGSQGYAMLLESGTGGNFTNNGTITTNGSQGYAIVVFGGNSSATNNGNITTAGFSSIGMFSDDPGNTLTNNGNITTSGNNAYGMLTSDTGTFTNNGRIVANGNANAMRSTGNNVTITNAGYARSVGSNSVAMTGTNNALVMKANGTVDGTVLYSGGGTRTLTYDVGNTGRGGSITRITGAITGAPTDNGIINTPTGMTAIRSGNTVAVVAPDQFGGTSQVISQTVSDASNVVNNRQQLALLGDTTEINSGSQYAASSDSASDAANPNDWAIRDRKVAWAEGFGSYQERGQTSDTANSQAISGGVLAGVDLPQTDDGIRAGYYVGGFAGALDVGNFRDVDSTGAMVGGYVGKDIGEYYVSGALGLGLSSNNSDRFTGVDTASADYDSYFASPSVTIMWPIDGEGVTYVPNATIRYTAQFDDSYTESGSVTNQSVGSRTSHSLDGRLMLDARFDPETCENGGVMKPTLRAGVQSKASLGSDTDVRVLGNNLTFDPSGDDNTVDAVFGANLSYAKSEKLELYADAEANLGLNHGGPSENYGAITRAGVKLKF